MARQSRIDYDKILPAVRRLADSLAESFGAHIVGAEFVLESGNRYLRILVQEPGGTTIATCEKVSRALSRALDAQDLVPGNYFLEVSSPGTTVESPDDTVPQPVQATPGEEELS